MNDHIAMLRHMREWRAVCDSERAALDAAIRALSADRGEAVAWLIRSKHPTDFPHLTQHAEDAEAASERGDDVTPLYAATPPSPADTSTGDDARHARENPPIPLPPATLLYENEGDGTKVYGYTAEQMQSRPAPPSPAESAERCPHCDDTGDVHRADGEWMGRCDCPAAAPSQVSAELIAAATEVLDVFGVWDDEPETETSEGAIARNKSVRAYARLRAALEAAQPQPGRVEGITRQQVNDLWMRTDCDGSTLTDHLHRFAKELLAAPTAGGDA